MSLQKEMMSWIIGRDTGLSSQTLWAVIMKLTKEQLSDYYGSIPYDTDDFGRCHRLLERCDPETRVRVVRDVSKRYPIWKPFSENWNTLTELFLLGKESSLDEMLRDLRFKPEQIQF